MFGYLTIHLYAHRSLLKYNLLLSYNLLIPCRLYFPFFTSENHTQKKYETHS